MRKQVVEEKRVVQSHSKKREGGYHSLTHVCVLQGRKALEGYIPNSRHWLSQEDEIWKEVGDC